MKISLTRKRVPVEITDEAGETKTWTLVEMSGAQRDSWLAGEKKRTKWRDGQPQGIEDFTNIQAVLISFCLKDEKDQDVPTRTIADFPASVQQELFAECERINGLSKKAQEEEKKD